MMNRLKQMKQIRKKMKIFKIIIKHKFRRKTIKKKNQKIKIKNKHLNRPKKNQYKWKEEMKQI